MYARHCHLIQCNLGRCLSNLTLYPKHYSVKSKDDFKILQVSEKVKKRKEYLPGLENRKEMLKDWDESDSIDQNENVAISPNIDPDEFNALKANFMDMDKSFDMNEKEKLIRRKLKVRTQTKKKHFREAKQPKLLTITEMYQIKLLHEQDPVQWTPEKLSMSFPATPDVILNVLNSNTHRTAGRMKDHDRDVKQNWHLLQAGQLTGLSPEYEYHLKAFSNRDPVVRSIEEYKKFEPPIKKYIPESTEFRSIITSYYEQLKMIKQTRAEQHQITSSTSDKLPQQQQITRSTSNKLRQQQQITRGFATLTSLPNEQDKKQSKNGPSNEKSEPGQPALEISSESSGIEKKEAVPIETKSAFNEEENERVAIETKSASPNEEKNERVAIETKSASLNQEVNDSSAYYSRANETLYTMDRNPEGYMGNFVDEREYLNRSQDDGAQNELDRKTHLLHRDEIQNENRDAYTIDRFESKHTASRGRSDNRDENEGRQSRARKHVERGVIDDSELREERSSSEEDFGEENASTVISNSNTKNTSAPPSTFDKNKVMYPTRPPHWMDIRRQMQRDQREQKRVVEELNEDFQDKSMYDGKWRRLRPRGSSERDTPHRVVSVGGARRMDTMRNYDEDGYEEPYYDDEDPDPREPHWENRLARTQHESEANPNTRTRLATSQQDSVPSIADSRDRNSHDIQLAQEYLKDPSEDRRSIQEYRPENDGSLAEIEENGEKVRKPFDFYLEEGIPTKYYAKHFTLDTFRGELETKAEKEPLARDEEVVLASYNTQEKLTNPGYSERINDTGIISQDVDISETDIRVELANRVEHYIHIPKEQYKEGALYKVDDCFYNCKGEFLYRVPGLKNA